MSLRDYPTPKLGILRCCLPSLKQRATCCPSVWFSNDHLPFFHTHGHFPFCILPSWRSYLSPPQPSPVTLKRCVLAWRPVSCFGPTFLLVQSDPSSLWPSGISFLSVISHLSNSAFISILPSSQPTSRLAVHGIAFSVCFIFMAHAGIFGWHAFVASNGFMLFTFVLTLFIERISGFVYCARAFQDVYGNML